MRHSTLAAALVGALAFATACGSGESSGDPATVVPSPVSSSPADSGQPKVENPLETASIDKSPCDVATAEQIEQLPGTVTETKTEETGSQSKSCAWFFDDERGDAIGSVRAGTVLENGSNGLQTLYQANSRGNLGYFEELPPVKGYPAVAYERAGKNEGDCTMAVGVRDDRVYSVSLGLWKDHPNYSDPCTVGRKIAEFAIEYLQGKQ